MFGREAMRWRKSKVARFAGRRLLAVLLAGSMLANSAPASAAPIVLWEGSITSATATPTGSGSGSFQRFIVSFTVSPDMATGNYGGGDLRIFDDTTGELLWSCSGGTSCSVGVDPAPGTTSRIVGYLWSGRPDGAIVVDTATVSVSDPGWQGSLTPAQATKSFVAAGATALFAFDVSPSLAWAQLDLLSNGDRLAYCTSGSRCQVGVWLGANKVVVVDARVVASQADGARPVVATASVIATSMSPPTFVDFLLNGTDSQLATVLGTAATPEAIAALRAGITGLVMDEAACLEIGAVDPTHPLNSTMTTTQGACSAGSTAASLALATTVGIGVLVATLVNYGSSDHPDQPAPEPSPQPQPDPIVPGGPHDPPATQVDTCQLPPGPDPDVFYFYQRDFQRVAIEQNGFVREVGEIGRIWVTDTLYGTAAEAQAYLSLPGEPPAGYYEIPAERLDDLFGPECVVSDFDQPGGGIQYWTTQSVYLGGLPWHPFP